MCRLPTSNILLVTVFVSSQQTIYSQQRNDACAGVPTSISWIPSWLHIRSRLAASIWGDFPLTAGEIAGFAPLSVKSRNKACRLGSLSLRLAAQLRSMELGVVGYPLQESTFEVLRPTLNLTHLSVDWRELRREGFDNVVQSGWPVFELFRRIQKLMWPQRESWLKEGHWYAKYDSVMQPLDQQWIDEFPRSRPILPQEGTQAHTPYPMLEALNESQYHHLQVSPLAWAIHYFLISAELYRKPGLTSAYFDDLFEEVPHDNMDGMWFRIFLRKGARHLHDVQNVLFSSWPILDILGQLTYTAILYSFNYSYVSPFYNNLADPSDQEGPPAVIEAGAHDGSDATAMGIVFPNTDIWAFEANPPVFVKLKENVLDCGVACSRVHVIECALGATDNSTIAFYANDVDDDSPWGADSSSSLYKPLMNGGRFTQFKAEPIDVRLVSLGTFAKEVEMGPVRYMELDAEGAELDILRGAIGLLPKVHAFKIEIRYVSPQLSGVTLFPDVKEWVTNIGFRMVAHSGVDAMFVRRDLALL